ncbi:AAA family ATPase [Dellaglioa sp. L3N]
MKITKVTIYGFGKWHDQVFDFSQTNQVIFGLNEAGKSTLTTFMLSMLFGFATAKKKYQQYLPKDASTYGGELELLVEDVAYRLTRTQGKAGGKVAIVNSQTGAKVASNQLQEWLKPVDENLYNQVFSFNQQALNQVFDLTNEDLNEYLTTMGAVGSQEWLELTKQIQKNADHVYKPAGRVTELNKEIAAYNNLVDKINHAKQKFPEYVATQKKLDQNKEAVKELQVTQQKLTKDQQRYEQLKQNWLIYAQSRALVNELKQVDGNEMISNDNYQTMQNLLGKQKVNDERLKSIDHSVASEQENLAALNLINFYEANQSDFDTLFTQLSENQQRLDKMLLEQTNLNQLLAEQERLTIQYQNSQGIMPTVFSTSDLKQVVDLVKLEESNKATLQKIEQSQFAKKQDVLALNQKINQENIPQKSKWSMQQMIVMGAIDIAIVLSILIFNPSKLIGWLGTVIAIVYTIYAFKQHNSKNKSNPTQLTQSQIELQTLTAEIDTTQLKINELTGQLNQTEVELTNYQMQYGLTDFPRNQWLPMQNDLNRLGSLTSQVNQKSAEIDGLSEAILTYLNQADFADSFLAINKNELSDGLSRIRIFNNKLKPLIAESQSIKNKMSYLDEQKKHEDKIHNDISNQINDLLTQYQLTEVDQFEKNYDSQKQFIQDKSKLDTINAQLPMEVRKELDTFESEASLNEQLAKFTEQATQIQNDIVHINQTIIDQKTALQTLKVEGNYTELRQNLAEKVTVLSELADKWLTQKLTINWINEALQDSSGVRMPQMIKLANHYFELLTLGRFTQINNSMGLLTVVSSDMVSFEIGELSQGTAEQLYIALRFALVMTINESVELPLIIDDGFVNFDKNRRNAVLRLIREISETVQVIYLTADDSGLTEFDSDKIIEL